MLQNILKLNIPYTIKLLDHFEYDSDSVEREFTHFCIVLELMGPSLYQYMQSGYKFNLGDINLILTQVLTSLNSLHDADFIHADIKIENILLDVPNKINEDIALFLNNKTTLQKIINKKKEYSKKNKEKNKINLMALKFVLCNDFMVNYKNDSIINENLDNIDNIDDNDDSDDSDDSDDESNASDEQKYDINDLNTLYDSNDKINITKIDLSSEPTIKGIRLTDFNTCIYKNKITYNVQTRYYRAPEIIIKSKYFDEKIDIWSVGCTLYELLTGKILLNKTEKYYIEDNSVINNDKSHISSIYKKIDIIPNDMWDNCLLKDIFVGSDYILKDNYYSNFKPYWFNIFNTYEKTDEILNLIKIMYYSLRCDPSKRFTSKQLLELL
jgi:serine/threonine protein kinase